LGLGYVENIHVSNDNDYNSYIDQINTGKYSAENCGPTVATMAIKWINRDFDKTVEQAREVYLPQGGWWSTLDVSNYLSLNNIDTSRIYFDNNEDENIKMKKLLDNNNILIVCVDMFKIRENLDGKYRLDRYYTGIKGHFLIIKGYRIVDEKLYYEIYDPMGYNLKYEDNQPKGKDRYYRGEEINDSMKSWWNAIIIVNLN
jgi:hypothetical protein